MARVRHISPAVWERLARLDGRFDFTMERRDVPRNKYSSGRNFARYWIVRIIDRTDDRRTIISEGVRLADVLEGAIRLAEDRVSRKAS